MNRLRSKWLYRGVLLFTLLFWIVAAVSARASDSKDKQKATNTLENAAKEAEKTGKAVDVNVQPPDPKKVEMGDLVLVNYTASLEDGSLIYTTLAKVAEDAKRKKSEGYLKNERFGPEETMAGKAGFMPAVGALAVGMKEGEKKNVTLQPENAFGSRDPKKMAQLPCEKRMPKIHVLEPRTYVSQLGTFPIVGKDVNLTPYFKSKVLEVTETYVKLDALVQGGEKSHDSFGTTEIKIDGNHVLITLTPKLGADFEMNNQKGRIVSTDGTKFTVDFNPHLAGRPVVLDLEVVSMTKASAFKGMEIAWMEDHDKTLEKAKKDKKPVVLLLYASWCSWSKKLMNESMEDPRIKVMKDKFIWAKVNSETQKDLYQFYEQKGYPLTVLLNSNGEIIGKIDGFMEAGALKKELEGALGTKVAKTN